jgi:hypothetical protein
MPAGAAAESRVTQGGRHRGGPRRQTGVPFAYVRLLGDRQPVDALTPTLDHIVIDRTG